MAREASLETMPRSAPAGAPFATPGYRRRIRILPFPGEVVAVLEDDIHALAVRLRHDGTRVLAVEPVIERLPWNTCPGAAAVLVETFAGVPLADVTVRKARQANCTHMHDMAVIAAAHAFDERETCYDIAVSDPVDGSRTLVLNRDGAGLLLWQEHDGVLVAPAQIAGRTLSTLRDWIAALPRADAEAARILQWAALVAHGRTIPFERQSEATAMPASCYTFQPAQAAVARRTGKVVDFSTRDEPPGAMLDRRLGLRPT